MLPLDGRHLPVGTIRVALKTHAPFPEQLLVRVDGSGEEPWKTLPVPPEQDGLRTAHFDWELHSGKNVLECRVVSAQGRQGRIARAVVTSP